MFCKYCGNKLPPNGRFCINCGKQIELDNIPKTAEDMKDNNTLSAEEQKEIRSIYRKALLIFFAVLVIMLIVLIIALYMKTQPHINMDDILNR